MKFSDAPKITSFDHINMICVFVCICSKVKWREGTLFTACIRYEDEVNDLDVSNEIAESQNSAGAQDVDVESCCKRRAEVETGSDVEDNGHLVSDQVAGLYTQS